MTKVKMTALDTIHLTSVQADSIRPGEQFEVDAHAADNLVERGLAARVIDASGHQSAGRLQSPNERGGQQRSGRRCAPRAGGGAFHLLAAGSHLWCGRPILRVRIAVEAKWAREGEQREPIPQHDCPPAAAGTNSWMQRPLSIGAKGLARIGTKRPAGDSKTPPVSRPAALSLGDESIRRRLRATSWCRLRSCAGACRNRRLRNPSAS